MTFSLVIPVLNEEDNIVNLFNELKNFFSKEISTDIKIQLVLVDDGSIDGTNKKIIDNKKILEGHSLKLIKLSKNFGSYNAYRAGLMHSDGEITTFMTADLQDPLILLKKMLTEILKGFDIVAARRNAKENKIINNFFSALYSFILRKTSIKDFPKGGCDIVMINNKVKKYLNEKQELNSSIVLQILSLGFKKSYIEYKKEKRQIGKSKWTLNKKINLFVDSILQYSIWPLRLITFSGIFISFLGFLWAGYLIKLKIFGPQIAEGWTALICVLVIGFGTINISLGIISEYIWRTLNNTRNRPIYIIDEIYKL
tara:strand:+ start:470 stop:1405 length:936 start_codon:yes stop_codon:yes gene_type:complete